MSTAEPITPPPAAPRRDPAPRRWSADEFRRVLMLDVFKGRSIALAEGQIVERLPDAADLRPVAFTQTEFCALWDANFFSDQRVRLIGGEILQESPVNPSHFIALRKATRVLERIFATGYDVRPQGPLNLAPLSRPHPDIVVVTGSMEDYAKKHPTTAVLVIEVSESTLEVDTHDMMSLYAAAGIPEYWVIDTTGRVLVFRDPRPESGQLFGCAYGRLTVHGRDEVIAPLAAPDARVNVNDLLP
jgi:Uma2 family endonuclease